MSDCEQPAGLLMPQGLQWIGLRRAPGGNKRCQDRDGHYDGGAAGERDHVARTDAVEERAYGTAGGSCKDESDGGACCRERGSAPQEVPDHVRAVRADRHADADLMRALL